jgi:NodT family efflux transporter outer membrane factor (OMF) lipoprotein
MSVRIALTGLLLLSAACALKEPPDAEELRKQALPNVALDRPWAAPGADGAPAAGAWLASFADPQLDALVQAAIVNNPDLRIGAARVEQAEGYVRIAKARLLPAISILGRGSTKVSDDFSTGLSGGIFSISWEVDLWGRLRYARNAAIETYASTQADQEYARQSIAAMTARGWFTAAETLLQRDLAEDIVRQADELVTLAGRRKEIGAGDDRDVVQAEANVAAYRDGLEEVRLAHGQALRALETLLGRYPATELSARRDLPALPGPVPTGMPLEMLERRPDLVAADHRVAAAFNRVGEAKAARLPTLSLNGSGGYITSNVLELKDDYENPSAGVGASLVAPIYTGGALKTQVDVRTSEQKQAVAEYARMALRAIGEVEEALAAAQTLHEREGILENAVSLNRRALELEQSSFRVGRSDMRSVLARQMALNAAQVLLLRVRSEQLTQRVNLHLALGGSFEEPPPTP